jgi:plasmid stabilization system protein ParE
VKVRISVPAQADLRAISRWIGNDSPVLAERQVERLKARCASLAEWPERFPVARADPAGEVRRCVEAPWLVYYRVEPKWVMILRILHAARDPEAAGLSDP